MGVFWTILTIIVALIAAMMGYESYYKAPAPTVPVPSTSVTSNSSPPIDWSWLTTEYFGIPTYAYILGIALILFALSRTSFGWVSTTFKPKAFGTKIVISFLVLSAFFFMLSHVYPDAPLFNTEEGKRHIFWYYVLVGLAALVAANFEGKEWFVYGVLIVFMFWMQGNESKRLLGLSGNLFARSAPLCAGSPPTQAERLGASGWTNIHHCDIGVAVASGSPPVLLVRPDGSTIRVVAGDYSLPSVVPVIFAGARPEGKEAYWFHIECEPGKWIPGTWRCRS